MQTTKMFGRLAAAACGLSLLAALGACESNDQVRGDREYRPSPVSEAGPSLHGASRPAPRPQPAQQAAAPAPRPTPAPAPRRSGNCSYYPSTSGAQSVVGLAFPTGDEASSALVLHQVMPNEVRRGANFGYEYHVTNITGGTLQNVAVTLESQENLTVVSADPASATGSDGSSMWYIGDLASCETRVIRVTAKADNVGNAANCVSVSYNNSLCAVTRVVDPALELTKTATPSALLCDPITLTYNVCNPGTGVADNVVIRDTLPAGLTTMDGGRNVEIPVGSLAAGECAERSISVKAASTGEFCSPASASAEGGLTADSGRPCTVVTAPSLEIACSSRDRQFIRRNAEYTFTVSNTGNGPAANTVVNLNFPATAEFISASGNAQNQGGRLSWNLGTLAAGDSRDVTVTLRSQASGRINVSATANGACSDPASTQCDVLYEGIPAILLETVDLVDPVEVGTNTTYVITVTNQGSAPDTNIRVVVTLPEEEEYVSATGATSGSLSGRTLTFAPVASLAAGAKVEWRVTVRAIAERDVRFAVSLTSDQFTRPIEETESTNLYE